MAYCRAEGKYKVYAFASATGWACYCGLGVCHSFDTLEGFASHMKVHVDAGEAPRSVMVRLNRELHPSLMTMGSETTFVCNQCERWMDQDEDPSLDECECGGNFVEESHV